MTDYCTLTASIRPFGMRKISLQYGHCLTTTSPQSRKVKTRRIETSSERPLLTNQHCSEANKSVMTSQTHLRPLADLYSLEALAVRQILSRGPCVSSQSLSIGFAMPVKGRFQFALLLTQAASSVPETLSQPYAWDLSPSFGRSLHSFQISSSHSVCQTSRMTYSARVFARGNNSCFTTLIASNNFATYKVASHLVQTVTRSNP